MGLEPLMVTRDPGWTPVVRVSVERKTARPFFCFPFFQCTFFFGRAAVAPPDVLFHRNFCPAICLLSLPVYQFAYGENARTMPFSTQPLLIVQLYWLAQAVYYCPVLSLLLYLGCGVSVLCLLLYLFHSWLQNANHLTNRSSFMVELARSCR